LPTLSKEEKIVKIVQNLGPAFRILIVDRDSMSSDLLASALVRDRRCDAAAIQSADLLHALSTAEVDLVVIGAEVKSTAGDGFDLAHAVGRAYPGISIVILLNHTTHESVINAFRSGARGVFSRQQSMSEFLDCVEQVRKGFIWAGRQETNSLLEAFRSIPAPNLITAPDSPTLTVRESQVVQCAAKGKTNRAIASELGLSEHTVKNYLFRAFEKLGVSSRVELLFYLTLRGHMFSPTNSDGGNLKLG
jgi:two-component system nitrate/nitrite response regulator NarL